MATPSAGGKRKRKRSDSISGPALQPQPGVQDKVTIPIPRGPGRFKYQSDIQSMMFAQGDIRKTNPKSSELMEDIVRQQVIGLLSEAARQTRDRGARQVVLEDLLFICRKDKLKLFRLTEHIANKAGQRQQKSPEERQKKRQSLVLRWDLLAELNEFTPENPLPEMQSVMSDVQSRLESADRLTASMSKEVYHDYAECRKLSFTADKRMKKFREWICLSSYTDLKVKEELVEALGFLALDCVMQLVKFALIIKSEAEEKTGYNDGFIRFLIFCRSAELTEPTPLEPWHIREALRRCEVTPHTMRFFKGGRASDPTFMRLLST